MLANTISSQTWLKIVGKEKLQTFQDAFAKLNGISLVFWNVDQSPLTVWSNAPLFCNMVAAQNQKRCHLEKVHAFAMAREEKQMIMVSCYLGLTYFVIPIYYNKQLVAYGCGGIVAAENAKISEKKLLSYHIPRLSYKHIEEIGETLRLAMELINLDVENLFKVTYGADNAQGGNLFQGKLSKREVEVARAICAGLNNKQVAEKLFISEKTVKSHVSNILLKLDLRDRVQLVVEYCHFRNSGEQNEHPEKD